MLEVKMCKKIVIRRCTGPCDTEAGNYPPTGCTQRQLETATVPWAWMTEDFPASPPGSEFACAGVMTHFPREQFDYNIVGNDWPGEGPSGSSGNCPYNFVSIFWTTSNNVYVDTRTGASYISGG